MISFDEFLNLLLLFFSAKHNLTERIQSVLKNHAFNNKSDTTVLSSTDANELAVFLNRFYGKLKPL
jgi:hypothetical protein